MIYLISYTPHFMYSQDDVHDFITNHLNSSDWWFYTNIYLLDTTLTIQQLTSSFRGRFPGMMHFIAKVDLKDTGGVLPKEAWDWINKKNRIVLKLQPLPPISALESYVKIKPTTPLPPIKQYDQEAIKSAIETLLKKGK